MTIMGTLLSKNSVVKRSVEKKLSPVLAKISTVFARIQKFDIMLGVITPKRHIVE